MFKGELSVRERTVQEKEKRGWGGRNELSKHVVPFRPPSAMISRVFRNVSCTPKSVSWLLPDRIYDGHAAPPPARPVWQSHSDPEQFLRRARLKHVNQQGKWHVGVPRQLRGM